MTTPGGVPSLPAGALTLDTIAEQLHDMTSSAMRSRAVERMPSIFNSSLGGDPSQNWSFLGIMSQIFAGFNSAVANADPADITGPEDLPGLLTNFIDDLPVVGEFVTLFKSIISGDFDLGDAMTAIEGAFNDLGAMLGLTDPNLDSAGAIEWLGQSFGDALAGGAQALKDLLTGIADATDTDVGAWLAELLTSSSSLDGSKLVGAGSIAQSLVHNLESDLSALDGAITTAITTGDVQPLIDAILASVGVSAGDGTILNVHNFFGNLLSMFDGPALISGSFDPAAFTVPVGHIPGLPASRITSGTFAQSMISGLVSDLAAKLTSSSPLDASNITSGLLSLAQLASGTLPGGVMLPGGQLTGAGSVPQSIVSNLVSDLAARLTSSSPLNASNITSGLLALTRLASGGLPSGITLPGGQLTGAGSVPQSLVANLTSDLAARLTASSPLDAGNITSGVLALARLASGALPIGITLPGGQLTGAGSVPQSIVSGLVSDLAARLTSSSPLNADNILSGGLALMRLTPGALPIGITLPGGQLTGAGSIAQSMITNLASDLGGKALGSDFQALLNNIFDGSTGSSGSIGKTLANVLSALQSQFTSLAVTSSTASTANTNASAAGANIQATLDAVFQAIKGGGSTGNTSAGVKAALQDQAANLLALLGVNVNQSTSTFDPLTALIGGQTTHGNSIIDSIVANLNNLSGTGFALTDSDSAHAHVADTLSGLSARVNQLAAGLTSGVSYFDDFERTASSLGSNWSVTYQAGSAGGPVTDGHNAVHDRSGTARRVWDARWAGGSTTTDNQTVTVTLNSKSERPNVMGGTENPGYNTVLGRISSDGQNMVGFQMGFGEAWIYRLVGGTRTDINHITYSGSDPGPGSSLTLVLGPGRNFSGYHNASGVITASDGTSLMGSAYRNTGFGGIAGHAAFYQLRPGGVRSWTGGDQ